MMRPADREKDLGAVALQAIVRAQLSADMAEAKAARRRQWVRIVALAFALLVALDLLGVF